MKFQICLSSCWSTAMFLLLLVLSKERRVYIFDNSIEEVTAISEEVYIVADIFDCFSHLTFIIITPHWSMEPKKVNWLRSLKLGVRSQWLQNRESAHADTCMICVVVDLMFQFIDLFITAVMMSKILINGRETSLSLSLSPCMMVDLAALFFDLASLNFFLTHCLRWWFPFLLLHPHNIPLVKHCCLLDKVDTQIRQSSRSHIKPILDHNPHSCLYSLSVTTYGAIDKLKEILNQFLAIMCFPILDGSILCKV